MENEMTLKESIDRLKLFGYYMDETPGGAIEVIVKAYEQREERIEKILKKIEEKIFTADLYGHGWDGQTVDNLLCYGDVYKILKDGLEKCV